MRSTSLTIVILFLLLSIPSSDVSADPPLPLPTMPICGDVDDPADPPVFNCPGMVPLVDIQAFQVPGDGPVELTFDFVYEEAEFKNELGFYKADDPSGTVAGLSPGSPGYLTAALTGATIVFPSGSNASTPDITLPFNGGDILVFFIIQDDTLENFLARNPNNRLSRLPVAFFSLDSLNPDELDHFVGYENWAEGFTQFGFEDLTYGGDFDYDDVVYNINMLMDPICPAGSWYAEYFDNRNLQGEPILKRCDNQIDFLWGEQGPDSSVSPGNFSVRWLRTVDFTQAGWYRFRAFTGDGMRLSVDGANLIDDWSPRSFAERSALVELAQGPHLIQMEYAEWSGQSLAYLQWYLCPLGKADCSLDIAPIYQSEYLTAPMPAGCQSGANQTIAAYGSALTSVVMALQQYGVATTPTELNNWLSGNDGYTGGSCKTYLNWDKILEFAKLPEHGGVSLAWQKAIDAAAVIRLGYPVLLQVDGGGHYALAVDAIEVNGVKSLGINDPHHSWACQATPASPPLPPASTLQCKAGPLLHASTAIEETSYRGTTLPLQYLQESVERTSSLQFTVQGAEVLLSNFQRQHVGYHEATSKAMTGIANSFYYDAEVVPPGGAPSGQIARTLYLPENAGGVYILRVIAAGGQSQDETNFRIDLFGVDRQFKSLKASTSGVLAADQSRGYFVYYNPGKILTISPLSQGFLPFGHR